jgi:hypothetical protein
LCRPSHSPSLPFIVPTFVVPVFVVPAVRRPCCSSSLLFVSAIRHPRVHRSPFLVVPRRSSFPFPVVRCSHSPLFTIPCRSSFPAAVVSRNSSSVVRRPGSPCSSFPAIRHRCRSSSSAPPYPPTSSGSQAGWWRCVTWHLRVVVVQKRGLLQPCEQMLTAAA